MIAHYNIQCHGRSTYERGLIHQQSIGYYKANKKIDGAMQLSHQSEILFTHSGPDASLNYLSTIKEHLFIEKRHFMSLDTSFVNGTFNFATFKRKHDQTLN